MTHRPARLGALGWRLLAAFLVVAVGAVGLLALVATVSVRRDTDRLAQEQLDQLAQQVAAALSAAYVAGQGAWQPGALSTLQVLVDSSGTSVTLLDTSGAPVATVRPHHSETGPGHGGATSSPSPDSTATSGPQDHTTESTTSSTGGHGGAGSSTDPTESRHVTEPTGSATPGDGGTSSGHEAGEPQALPESTAALDLLVTTAPAASSTPANDSGGQTMLVPIVVDGTTVGSARIQVPASATSSVEAARDSLLRNLAVGTALAVLLAVVAATVVTRRVSRPLVALTDATRAFAAGDADAGRLVRPAPGELGEVGRAFTAMAGQLARQGEQRRAVMADVAHELRTPVAILRGQTEQLLDGIVEPSTTHLVSLHDEVLRLERLTDDLATLSTADDAGLALHLADVDLADVAERVADAMGSRLQEGELTLATLAPDPVVVRADPTRVAQILSNLLTNAAKFTPPGGHLEVRVSQSGRFGELLVEDSGTGIPVDELPHVFDRYWRGRGASARSGSGIGLAVVASLVSAQGGSVVAESALGAGARFRVLLPLAPPPAAAATGGAADAGEVG